MFFVFFHVCSCVVLGMDLGGEKARVTALYSPQQMSILMDRNNNRYFRTTFTIVPKNNDSVKFINVDNFDDYEYYFDNPHMERKFPQFTTRYYNDFVGKVLSDDMQEIMNSRNLSKVAEIISNHRFTLNGIFPEYLLYRTFNMINESMHAQQPIIKDRTIYISVPRFMMQQERKSVRICAKLANFTSRIIDSSTALAYHFAFTHDRIFSRLQKPLTVGFIDIGDINTQITVTQFSGKKNITVKDLFYNYSQKIGGRSIDLAISNIILRKLDFGPTDSDKQLILQEANKIKHRLTTNKNAVGQIDCTNIVYYNVTRDEFETEISGILEELTQLLKTSPPVDRIQLIGGSTRILSIQDTIKKVFNQKELFVSMNPEEAISNGAALYGVTQSSEFKTLSTIIYQPLHLYRLDYYDSHFKPVSSHAFGQQVYLLETANRYPAGCSGVAAWGTVHVNTVFKATTDGLYRIKQDRKRVYEIWEIKFVEQAKLLKIHEDQNAKLSKEINGLENMILESKVMIRESGFFEQVCSEQEYIRALNAVNATDRWFTKQKKFNLEALQQRRTNLEDSLASIMARVQYLEKANMTIENMTKVFNAVEQIIVKKWVNKTHHPPRSQIRHILRAMAYTKNWLNEKIRLQGKISVKQNPILKYYELENLIFYVQDEFMDVLKGINTKNQDNKQIHVQGDVEVRN